MSEHLAADDRYDRMTYRRTGRSGLLLPRISLGLWNSFGTDRALETQRAILLRAFDLGVTHIDLANNYGPPPGAAESAFGRVLASDLHPYRDELVVSTKAGYLMGPGPYGEWGSRKHLLASLERSLGRLGLEHVDVFYSHRPDPGTPIEETMGALATAVRQGKALYAGISNYSPDQTRAAAAALDAEGVPLLVHQPRYNMFDRGFETLIPVLEQLGVGAVVFSPLGGGLLTDRYLGGVPGDSRAATGRWMTGTDITPAYLDRIRAIGRIAEARGQSIAQLALTWVLRHGAVTSALIGASRVEQLEDSLRALDAPPLSEAELAALEPLAAPLAAEG
ncbi:aldo/keto reductase [uncultured Amnibacterium sp.]|uniref:aldo/keto reductase n=1 Tax=uncultured Amnibacterium sp. TaxID=1631851 RepID=UPI0035CADDFD